MYFKEIIIPGSRSGTNETLPRGFLISNVLPLISWGNFSTFLQRRSEKSVRRSQSQCVECFERPGFVPPLRYAGMQCDPSAVSIAKLPDGLVDPLW